MKKVKIKLRDIAHEARQIVSPTANLPFLGLEQIEAQTGHILSYSGRPDDGIGNAFAFDTSHVLYGKLRPYLNKVALPEKQGRCSTEIVPLSPRGVSRDFLACLLRTPRVVAAAMRETTGSRMPRANMDVVLDVEFHVPSSDEDRASMVLQCSSWFEMLSKARQAARDQLDELNCLANSLVTHSLSGGDRSEMVLDDVLAEVKEGIGSRWQEYPVLGATRNGLAPAKERPGKHADRYKPVTAGTVFYNPMRILIGSIAFVDDDDEPGITSPDYVVLKGKPGVVDSRWFYYWLRSPLGERCIQSLARGAVRERMLFNRLAEGEIELPDYDSQVKASKALAQIKPMRAAIHKQLAELELLPQKLLAQVFEN
jgi:type I restriction enzyme S subunit